MRSVRKLAWELIEKIYPLGRDFNNIGFADANFLRENSNIEIVTCTDNKVARDMIIQTITYTFTKDNQFSSNIDYDICFTAPHVDPLAYPLNVYGMAMVQDYNNYYGEAL